MLATERAYQFKAEEWLSQNMHRNYPLADDQVVITPDGEALPSSFLADLSIRVLPGLPSTAIFYLSSVTCTGPDVAIDISYHDNNEDFVCARASGISNTLRVGDSVASRTFVLYPAAGIPDEYDALRFLSGSVIIGSCADLTSMSYKLAYTAGRILSTCIIQSLAGIESVTFTGSATNETLTTDFTIQAGDGIDFELQDIEDPATHRIEKTLIIHRVPTMAERNARFTTVEQVVTAVLTELGQPIRSINGVIPDENGNIRLLGDDCMKIDPGAAGLELSNPCAKPCCGDATPSDVASTMQSLEDVENRLLSYFESLTNSVNAMQGRLATLISSN